MPPSATSRAKLQGQSGVRRVALSHGMRAFVLSLAVVVLGGGPSSPLAPSISSVPSSKVTSRFGFVGAAATTTEHATAKKQLQVENEEEEDELYSWYDERSTSAGSPLGLERNLAPVVDAKIAPDDPDLFLDSGSDLVVLLEGCTLPAETTSVRVHNDKPTSGNIAENTIDGDPNTW